MSNYTVGVMANINRRFAASGLSLEEFGVRMGYPEATSRKSAWQFLKKTIDPRLSMVEKAAAALGVSVSELVGGGSVPTKRPPTSRQTV